ncbi:MAG: hypothetical protein JWL83_167 [Actinomycetia bacterium]|nr:hypothetical protein [Actinomycetes bacterium]
MITITVAGQCQTFDVNGTAVTQCIVSPAAHTAVYPAH